MIITPRVFVVVIATGLYWLLAIATALFLVAGIVRGFSGFLLLGFAGMLTCTVIRILYTRNKERLRDWVRSPPDSNTK